MKEIDQLLYPFSPSIPILAIGLIPAVSYWPISTGSWKDTVNFGLIPVYN